VAEAATIILGAIWIVIMPSIRQIKLHHQLHVYHCLWNQSKHVEGACHKLILEVYLNPLSQSSALTKRYTSG